MKIDVESNRLKKASLINFKIEINRESFEYINDISSILGIQEDYKVSISGRIVGIRGKGKVYFADLFDLTSTIQIFIDITHSDYFQNFKDFVDTGDYIRVWGTLKKNKQRDTIIQVKAFELIAKSLFILPQKLSQKTLKQEYRFVDTVISNNVANIITNQPRITKAIREVLWGYGFSEYITPTLSTNYNGGAARPFETDIRSLGAKGYLRVTSEIYLKSLIASGERKVFEICSQFRNEGLDSVHLPEFLMLEAYQAEASADMMLKLVLDMFEKIAIAVNGLPFISTPNGDIKCSVKDWEFFDVYQFLLNEKGVDILGDEKYLRKKLELYNIEAGDESSYATLVAKFINFFVLREIERPLVINGLPHGLTPLMKPHPDDNRFADRYWLFINKTDFCDIGSEQANYEDQKRALYQQYKELNTKKAHANVNNDILNILAFGIPPIAGIGMSLSRIMMLLGNVQDIREAGVFYFQ